MMLRNYRRLYNQILAILLLLAFLAAIGFAMKLEHDLVHLIVREYGWSRGLMLYMLL
jgi:hypothetical protein